MKPELKKKWLEALKSGRYKQGQGMLRAEDKYCCLGVLCDLIDPKQWVVKGEQNWFFFDGDRFSLSVQVQFDTGIQTEEMQTLVKMNDSYLAGFKEIARWIEKNL